MARQIHRTHIFAFVLTLALGGLAASSVTGRERPSRPFDQAELFVELNNSKPDLGLHGAIDGGTWTNLEIDDPRDRPLLGMISVGRLRAQGLTQLALESQEPTFDELDPVAFFRRFPEGVYEIEADAADGGTFRNEVRLSHVMAAPVEPTVNGQAPASCESAVLPIVSAPVLIDWEPVTRSHPTIGRPGPVTITRYQFFVDHLTPNTLSIDLDPTVTEFEIPAAVLTEPGIWKFEIIARTSANNNTAFEGCFLLR